MRVYFIPRIHMSHTQGNSEPLDFFLLVFSTVLIAAAGNIINDYFDVKADKINKPHKVIIGKYIKPRWAIVLHWILNFVAFAIACYLSWRYKTFWYVFIHLLSINALWFYSMYFKRRFLIGNIIIAGLTALVPILCGIHFLEFIQSQKDYLPASWTIETPLHTGWAFGSYFNTFVVLVFAFYAGTLNLIREIIKDIEDVEGDLVLRAKTLPIVLGKRKTKIIAMVLLVLLLLTSVPFLVDGYFLYRGQFLVAFAPILLIPVGILFVIGLLGMKTDGQLKTADFLLKILMAIGCSMPFYWYFL
ncbi:geranylgeranylglycerol-phosphate geranylgeranyltransferase [Fluviicola sp.]|uniref:geranylgeranylglycerol-phosphate geranylgeranyltransferase n=1 Tax=Fluviicola sp. TaxID=1917219 RepID=UPI0031DF2215